jgi:hypothetical protein
MAILIEVCIIFLSSSILMIVDCLKTVIINSFQVPQHILFNTVNPYRRHAIKEPTTHAKDILPYKL